MPNHTMTDVSESLYQFLNQADQKYRQSIETIPLFNPEKISNWDKQKQKIFASVFYHLRGHFINFLWYMANFSRNPLTKKVILENIHEELGTDNCFSHEMLYERFAQECGVDIHDEIINETHYLPFAKTFNRSHLEWLATHEEEERVAAFAAYERLDNLDYSYLVHMADTMVLSQHAKTFFRVHAQVTHFDSTLELILPVWEKTPDKVIHAFNYIYKHQQQMWHDLSNYLFSRAGVTPH